MVFSGIAGITGFHEKDGENIHSETNSFSNPAKIKERVTSRLFEKYQ